MTQLEYAVIFWTIFLATIIGILLVRESLNRHIGENDEETKKK